MTMEWLEEAIRNEVLAHGLAVGTTTLDTVRIVAGMARDSAALREQVRRLQDLLDCETGKRAPEGWTFNGMWNHTSGAQVWRVIARVKHDHGCAVFRWHLAFTEGEDGTPYPSALEAIEAAEKRMVEE